MATKDPGAIPGFLIVWRTFDPTLICLRTCQVPFGLAAAGCSLLSTRAAYKPLIKLPYRSLN